MSHVGAYFDRVLLTALVSPKIKRVEQVRREHDATGRVDFKRYRLTLINADLVELTEGVEVQAREIVVTKYRHHWQNQVDAMAMADQYCRIHSLEGLPVVDATVMPDVVRANTHATTLMMAERVADWLRAWNIGQEIG